MLLRLFARPAVRQAAAVCQLASISPATCSIPLRLPSSRSYETAARTKRALKVAPHESFLPNRSSDPIEDHIIYNPPDSQASPMHTPFLFLPLSDPRRKAIAELRRDEIRQKRIRPTASANGTEDGASEGANDLSDLPPAMRYPRRQPNYNLTEKEMREMRLLRNQDPIKWSVGQLARKYNCSPIFVSMVAPAPPGHLEWLRQRLDRKMARWGPMRTQARDDRRRRAEMLYRGEL